MFMLEPEDSTALRYAGEFMRQDRRFVLEALRQELKPVGRTGDWRFALFGPVWSNQYKGQNATALPYVPEERLDCWLESCGNLY